MRSVQIRNFFWSVFSCIRTEYGDLLPTSSYSARIQENTDREKLSIWTFFMQCRYFRHFYWFSYYLGYRLSLKQEKKRWCSHLSMSLFPSVHLSVCPSFCPWCDLKNRIFFLIVSSDVSLARKFIERRCFLTALTLGKLKINIEFSKYLVLDDAT